MGILNRAFISYRSLGGRGVVDIDASHCGDKPVIKVEGLKQLENFFLGGLHVHDHNSSSCIHHPVLLLDPFSLRESELLPPCKSWKA